jgi:hypothetical protein
MADPRRMLERELDRIAPPPFTLEAFHKRRERTVRNQRIAGAIGGIAVALAGLIIGLRLIASTMAPVPAVQIGARAVASLDPSGLVVTTAGRSITIVSADDLAGICPGGIRCGFLTVLAWSPDGGRLAFAVGDRDTSPRTFAALYVVHADGSDLRRIGDCVPVRSHDACTEVAWSPDGSKIAWVASSHLWVVDLATDVLRDLVGPPGCGDCADALNGPAADIAWSPDGTRVAYTGGTGLLIGVVAADGSSTSVLVDRLPRGQLVSEPAWSPDGSSVLFSSRPWHSEDAPGLWIEDLVSRRLTQVVTGTAPLRLSGGTWSPDGSLIAWRAGDLSVWVARPDGSKARPVYRVTSGDDLDVFDGPWFSSDGSALMFQAPTGNAEAPRTVVIPVNGGQPQTVPGWSAAWGQGPAR